MKKKTTVRKNGKVLHGAAAAAVLKARAKKSKPATAAKTTRAKASTAKRKSNGLVSRTVKKVKRAAAKKVTDRLLNPKKKTTAKRKRNTTAKPKPKASTKNRTARAAKSSRKPATAPKRATAKASTTRKRTTRRRNPAAPPNGIAKLHRDFFGREVDGYTVVEAPAYFPNDVMLVGEAPTIDYIAQKEHIGKGKKYQYTHKFGEEGGSRPNWVMDKHGNLLPLGGDYEIKPEGIRN
jgi:hypothetical protein